MVTRDLQKEQLSWYESDLPLRERKKRGHFSTPPMLVEWILDACGYSSEANLTQVRMLDPACGSGNFLVGAAQRLAAFSRRTGLTQIEHAALISQNLWGLDPDPVACFLAEMQLHACLGDANMRLHIHQADALVLPWEPCVDLFVANPPYLAVKNNDLSGYRSAQRGQSDSYLLFLNVALQAVRPNGWVGLVLPDPVLARNNASRERMHLLEKFTIHHLWHLSDVFAAEVGAVVIVAQKNHPPRLHQVSWMRERWQSLSKSEEGQVNTVSQSLFLQQPAAELRYLLSSERGAAIEQLRTHLENVSDADRHFAPLQEFLAIVRGEELGKESVYLTDNCSDDNHPLFYPVLRGGVDIQPYVTPSTGWWIAREGVKKPLERYLAPKLLVVKSTGRLQATLDVQGHVALQTLYLLHLREKDMGEDDLYFFLALLNSRLLRDYVYVLHTAYKWVQPQIEQHVLAKLPVPIVEQSEKQGIIERAKLLVRAYSEGGGSTECREYIEGMYEEQECAVCKLYGFV